MKYILLMMNCSKTGYDTFGAWPKNDIQAHIAFMHGLNKALRESGELVSAEGLASPHQAKVVRAGTRWGADEHADRGAAGDERAARRVRVTRPET